MDRLKERLYEPVDAVFEGPRVDAEVLGDGTLRFSRRSDGSFGFYVDDRDGRANGFRLTREEALELYGQMKEALKITESSWVPYTPYPMQPLRITTLPVSWGTTTHPKLQMDPELI